MNKMNHCMLDLETLGTRPGDIVMSIGAVMFDVVGGLGAEFHTVISVQDSKALGLQVTEDTMNWWDKQNKEAKTTLYAAHAAGAPKVKDALGAFGLWLMDNASAKDVRVWGCGSDFDNVLLKSVYDAADIQMPWIYWNNRCYRTLKALRPSIKIDRSRGVYHNALDDAKNQALHAIQILRTL